ncbi:acyl-CoA/acyl-ACP dehydrogenase [Puniceicoccaceae bacterium K14]|nr:acyl-CoA/acyl-ACP dehydrogenase [Puniceicoccaceae bacterium K14]
MDFNLSKEQQELKSKTYAFAKSLSKDLLKRDKESVFDSDAWKEIAKNGLLKGFVPKNLDGFDWDATTRVAALEAFGEGCSDNGLCLALSSLVWTIFPPILSVGTDEQKNKYIPKLLAGDFFAADGITEESAGSDAIAMKASASLTKDGYRLNGKKSYIGFAPIADLVILFAKTDPNMGAWGVSTFLVETDIDGITLSHNNEKMGLRTLPMGSIKFDNCLVPESARLGEEGVGMSLFNESMEWERSFILATQVGTMARQLKQCVAYAKSRKQFGSAIGANQSISNRIADMRTRLETCRLLLYKTAWLKDQGKTAALEASMTKLTISEAFVSSSLDAVRIHGARGYLSEFEIERDLRDATGGLIYAGTSDIQRNLIARLAGL